MGRFIQNCDVMMVVDGDLLYEEMINTKTPFSKDKDNPTQIWNLPNRNKYQYLIAENRFVGNKQGTSDLELINLRVNDEISFRGITVDGNTDYSVIVYEINKSAGENVMGTFVCEVELIKEAALPSSGYIPGSNREMYHYGSSQIAELGARLIRTGTELYEIYFALFKLTENSDKHELLGYFKWDPKITVK